MVILLVLDCCLMLCAFVTVALGTLPGKSVLSLLASTKEKEEGADVVPMVQRASTLLSLLASKEGLEAPISGSRIWLGDGLGPISRKSYDKILRGEFVDLGEFRQRSPLERVSAEGDTHKLVVLPGFEVSQVRGKPIKDIFTWVHCFARYTAAVAGKFPECAPGLMSHLVTVMKAYVEVEDPAWRVYDIAFREKMAATEVKEWKGMDIQLYQEVCGGRPRKRQLESARDGGRGAVAVCWKFNNGGVCRFGSKCKFPHICEECGGGHSKMACDGRGGALKKWKGSGPK